MKVLLVESGFPKRIREYLALPSLELCVLSSILKQNNHDVEMLDMKINKIDAADVEMFFPKEAPQIVCFADDISTHCVTLRVAQKMKDWWPEVKIAFRGEIATFAYQRALSHAKCFDFALRFDDDYSLLYVIQSLESNRDVANIPNIAYRDQVGNIYATRQQKRCYALDSLPMPDRKLHDLQKYLKRDAETIVRSSRGCPGNCLFCIKTKMAQFDLFSVERFCDELEQLKAYGFQSFFFSDDTFAFSDERLRQFYDEVVKRGMDIRWTSNLRIKDINEYKLRHMKEIGAYRVFLGIETVNKKTSKMINKNLIEESIRRKINLLHKYNMEFHASFIIGNPNDTEEDLEQMISFVKDIRPTLVTFNQIKVTPGLDLYNNPEKYGIDLPNHYWYETDEWSHKAIAGTKDLPPEVIESWSKKLLWEFMS